MQQSRYEGDLEESDAFADKSTEEILEDLDNIAQNARHFMEITRIYYEASFDDDSVSTSSATQPHCSESIRRIERKSQLLKLCISDSEWAKTTCENRETACTVSRNTQNLYTGGEFQIDSTTAGSQAGYGGSFVHRRNHIGFDQDICMRSDVKARTRQPGLDFDESFESLRRSKPLTFNASDPETLAELDAVQEDEAANPPHCDEPITLELQVYAIKHLPRVHGDIFVTLDHEAASGRRFRTKCATLLTQRDPDCSAIWEPFVASFPACLPRHDVLLTVWLHNPLGSDFRLGSARISCAAAARDPCSCHALVQHDGRPLLGASGSPSLLLLCHSISASPDADSGALSPSAAAGHLDALLACRWLRTDSPPSAEGDDTAPRAERPRPPACSQNPTARHARSALAATAAPRPGSANPAAAAARASAAPARLVVGAGTGEDAGRARARRALAASHAAPAAHGNRTPTSPHGLSRGAAAAAARPTTTGGPVPPSRQASAMRAPAAQPRHSPPEKCHAAAVATRPAAVTVCRAIPGRTRALGPPVQRVDSDLATPPESPGASNHGSPRARSETVTRTSTQGRLPARPRSHSGAQHLASPAAAQRLAAGSPGPAGGRCRYAACRALRLDDSDGPGSSELPVSPSPTMTPPRPGDSGGRDSELAGLLEDMAAQLADAREDSARSWAVAEDAAAQAAEAEDELRRVRAELARLRMRLDDSESAQGGGGGGGAGSRAGVHAGADSDEAERLGLQVEPCTTGSGPEWTAADGRAGPIRDSDATVEQSHGPGPAAAPEAGPAGADEAPQPVRAAEAEAEKGEGRGKEHVAEVEAEAQAEAQAQPEGRSPSRGRCAPDRGGAGRWPYVPPAVPPDGTDGGRAGSCEAPPEPAQPPPLPAPLPVRPPHDGGGGGVCVLRARWDVSACAGLLGAAAAACAAAWCSRW